MRDIIELFDKCFTLVVNNVVSFTYSVFVNRNHEICHVDNVLLKYDDGLFE